MMFLSLRKVLRPVSAVGKVGRLWLGGPIVLGLLGLVLSSCASSGAAATSTSNSGVIPAVAAENEYGNVLQQVGGRYVAVNSVMSNPNTDPHTFESSPSVAQEVGAAQIVIQNGLGYDTFMQRIEGAAPRTERKVIDVQNLLNLPASTPNPHLWYNPTTMPVVAKKIAQDLSSLQPAHARYFQTNAKRFVQSLNPWIAALAHFKKRFPNTPVATTEPVGDYMLEAAGTVNKTPFTLQAAIMNGIDPAPQDVSLQEQLLSSRSVKVFIYNQQVTNPLTQSFLGLAQAHHIPVVGVYETMPTPQYSYQSWMLAEVRALTNAVANHVSTQKL